MPISSRTLFLLDGAGALLSAVLLGLVLPRFESFFGMPRETLYLLAAFPLIFAGFDLWAYFRPARHLQLMLRIIALLNLGYCGFSLAMVVRHYATLTGWGLAYFAGELLIVLTLAGIEWRLASRRAPLAEEREAGA
jgi:hypothetical protein